MLKIGEITISKEANLTAVTVLGRLRRLNTDGSIAQDREWPPRTIVKNVHNTGNTAEKAIGLSASQNIPIPIIGFWGAGDKKMFDAHDLGLIDHLTLLNSAAVNGYKPGLEITLLLADIHARYNGYTSAEEYLGQIASLAQQRGFNVKMLSELYAEWNLQVPEPNQLANHQDLLKIWEDERYERQQMQLIESAGRHHRNGTSPEQAAFGYFVMRKQEKEPLAAAFPNTLLFANTSPDLGGWLLPKQQMPILYMRAKAPWFQTAAN